MNRNLYKMQQIGDRLWILATNTAMVAASLGRDGRGFAIVAEETRYRSNKLQHLVERAMFENEEIEAEKLKESAQGIMSLALNAAIESHRLRERGKQAAVCAEEIRSLAYALTTIIADDMPLDRLPDAVIPRAKSPLTSVMSDSICFILLKTGDTYFVENLLNIEEVFCGLGKTKDSKIVIRGVEIPVICTQDYLNINNDNPTYVILRTPWVEERNQYAVAVDSFGCLFYSPIGSPVAPPADMPLAEYVRECWENENGDPFYFMDWNKMAAR